MEKKEDELVLRLKNTPETELCYPFLFELDICWKPGKIKKMHRIVAKEI